MAEFDYGGAPYSGQSQGTASSSNTRRMVWDAQSKSYVWIGGEDDKRTSLGMGRDSVVGSSRLRGTTSTTTTTPIKPGGAMPTFTLPGRDEGRVSELRSKGMYPVRGLRQEFRRGLANLGEGPNAQRAYRGALEGLGSGISSIAGQAGIQAENLYGRERSEEITALSANFQAQMQDYLNQYGQESTGTQTYDYGNDEDFSDMGAFALKGIKGWEPGAQIRRI